MGILFQRIKTILTSLFIVISLVTVSIITVHAQTPTDEPPPEGSNVGSNSEEYLRNIMNNTYAILYYVKNLPTYLQILTKMAMDWTEADTSDTTATMQANFTSLSNAFTGELTGQTGLQTRILGDLFGDPKQSPTANDLAYQTLIGIPFTPERKDQNGKKIDSAYNYLTYASGIKIPHEKPNPYWPGITRNKTKYEMFYNSVMATESFNAYVLSKAYADYAQGGAYNQLQTTLITAASSGDWFQKVASESIGVVLRQILLYESQTFVMISQLLQTQRQALISQSMTNTLLILNAGNTESTLLNNASTPPQ